MPRRYTLDEVRYSPDLRAHMRSVDIDTINFDSGSWTVTPDQAGRLRIIADAVRQAVERAPNEVFMVEGHTDAAGTRGYNLNLSQRRAQAVVRYLGQHGVEASRLIAKGYGQSRPIAPDPLSGDNRRVETRLRAE